MPYNPTDWVEGVTPLGPTNMNKIEQGVKDAHDEKVDKAGDTMTGLLRSLMDATTRHEFEKAGMGSKGRTLFIDLGSGNVVFGYSLNAYWDGTNWQRDDTTMPSFAALLHASANRIEFCVSAPGTGGIAWTTAQTISTAGVVNLVGNLILSKSESSILAEFNSTVAGTLYSLYMGADQNQPWFGSKSNHDVRLLTNNVERGRMKASGNLEWTGGDVVVRKANPSIIADATSGDAVYRMRENGAERANLAYSPTGAYAYLHNYAVAAHLQRWKNTGQVEFPHTAGLTAAGDIYASVQGKKIGLNSGNYIGYVTGGWSLVSTSNLNLVADVDNNSPDGGRKIIFGWGAEQGAVGFQKMGEFVENGDLYVNNNKRVATDARALVFGLLGI